VIGKRTDVGGRRAPDGVGRSPSDRRVFKRYFFDENEIGAGLRIPYPDSQNRSLFSDIHHLPVDHATTVEASSAGAVAVGEALSTGGPWNIYYI
jgi:hypothetical protein